MAYIDERKAAIFSRYNAGMSLRRISEIYGVPTHEVEDAIKTMTRANATEQFLAASLLGPDGRPSKPGKHWNSFPQEIQSFAVRVAQNFKVPVVTLFMKGGRTRPEMLARGCFYHKLKTQHGWSAARIGRSCDRSEGAVMVAINLHEESMIELNPNMLKATTHKQSAE